jgi:aerobic-type carbon monoxide dehydrogenase small subunit (CoxS/CutS family)
MRISFAVNDKPVQFEGPADVPLLWVVREHLG